MKSDLASSTPATSFSESSLNTCGAKCTSWGPHGASKHQDAEEYVQHALLLPADQQCMFTSEDLGLLRPTTSGSIVLPVPSSNDLHKLLIPKLSSSGSFCHCHEDSICQCGLRPGSPIVEFDDRIHTVSRMQQADGVTFPGYRSTAQLGQKETVYAKSAERFPIRDEEMMGAGMYRISREASQEFIIDNAIKRAGPFPDLFASMALKNLKLPGYDNLTYNEILLIKHLRTFPLDPNMYKQDVDEHGICQQFGFPIEPRPLCLDRTPRYLRSATWELADPTARSFNMAHCHYANGLCAQDAIAARNAREEANEAPDSGSDSNRAQRTRNNEQSGTERARHRQPKAEQSKPEFSKQFQRRQRKPASPLRHEIRPEDVRLFGPAPQAEAFSAPSARTGPLRTTETLAGSPKADDFPELEFGPARLIQENCELPLLGKAVHAKTKERDQRRVQFALPPEDGMGPEEAIASSPSPIVLNALQSAGITKSPVKRISASVKRKTGWQPPPPQEDLRTIRSNTGQIVPSLASGDHPLVQRRQKLFGTPNNLEVNNEPAQDYTRDAANLLAQSVREKEKQSLILNFEFVSIPRFVPHVCRPSDVAATSPDPNDRPLEESLSPPSGSENSTPTPNGQFDLSLYSPGEETRKEFDDHDLRPVFADSPTYTLKQFMLPSPQIVQAQRRHVITEPGCVPFTPTGEVYYRQTQDAVAPTLVNQAEAPPPAPCRRCHLSATSRPLPPSMFDNENSAKVDLSAGNDDVDDISSQGTVKPLVKYHCSSTLCPNPLSKVKDCHHGPDNGESGAKSDETPRQEKADKPTKTLTQAAPQVPRRRSNTVVHRPVLHRRTSSKSKVRVIIGV